MIKAVLAKLEELSPYENPSAFTADGQMENVVRPVWSYADEMLDESIKEAVTMLPLKHLTEDIDNITVTANIDADGVGTVEVPDDKEMLRMAYLQFPEWERSVTRPVDEFSDIAMMQSNPFTRGGTSKPVVVWLSGDKEWKCYSFPQGNPRSQRSSRCGVVWMPDKSRDEGLQTKRAAEYAILLCAIQVHGAYNNTANVKFLREELQTMLSFDNIVL